MDDRSLELFAHLAKSLHFGKTSGECAISPSALSRTIQRLEDELGAALFLRDNRSVELTEAGRKLLVYAEDTLTKWKHLKTGLSAEAGEVTGQISLYCSVTACFAILPDIIASFRERYPKVHLNIQTGAADRALTEVSQGLSDISVVARPDSLPESLSFREITRTPLTAISADPEKTAGFFTVGDDLSSVPLVLPDSGLARKRIDAWFARHAIQPNIYAEVSGNEAILALVSLGCGVGIVPELVFEKSPVKGEMRRYTCQPKLEPYIVGLCAKQKRLQLPVVSAFWECIIKNP
ncbi:MAG: HTH-type transcriptional activator IlvY [Spirochaetia bacterium]